jgi:uncharacterized protein (TIGR02284 family)
MNATETLPYTVNYLNGLLRGEMAAVETYEQALPKIHGEPLASEARRIREEHRDAVAALQDEVRREGGWPDGTSGLWGAFAQVFEGTAKLFGGNAALRGLLQGEEHGVVRYNRALQDPRLPEPVKALIHDTLLPKVRDHVRTLKALLHAD